MIVYKYLPTFRIDVLEQSRIRFTEPAVLNDPFETFPCFLEYGPWLLDKTHQQAIKKFGMQAAKESYYQRQSIVVQTLLDIPKTLSKYFVMLSVSKIRNNLLMWSHYADSHKGFVIGFDSTNTFFSPRSGKAKDGLKPVRYSKNRYIVPKSGLESLEDIEMHNANTQIFFTKAPCWRYEKEMRILARPGLADVVLPNSDGYDIRLYNFPIECVKEVIFGFKMQESIQHRFFDLVRFKYPHATIGKAFPNESKFELDIKMFAN